MSKMQRTKGATGERELRDELERLFGVTCERTAQRCGKGGTADVRGLDGVHVECKRTESLSVYAAMEQAVADSQGTGDVPVVFHRRSRKKWLAIVELDRLPELVAKLYLVLAGE